ncbi:type I secretion system permease/ATPase [Mesorhizobium denitrificans]|uniref:Type I secretion system permease/ATPase n=2 Tax=Phyllobacteriaceae TaxID=69277 RepID=A0A371X3Y1_9HYPH|nr:type I secretion system permease/ATPase [Mesorhizobium denitrificans]
MESWTQALLLVAKQIGVRSSPELVRNAAAWAPSADVDQAVIDIAHAAGLSADFRKISAKKLTAEMLPVLIVIGESRVGVITEIADGKFSVAFAVEDSFIERKIPIANAARKGSLKVLTVAAREQIQDDRLESYLRQKPDTWLRHLLLKNWSTFAELGAASLFANLIGIATSLFAMQVWDRVVPARSFETLWVLASGVLIALVIEFTIRMVRVELADYFGKDADQKLSLMFFARALDIRNDARPRSPGTLISQLRDLDQVREFFTSTAIGVMIDVPFIVAFLFIMWILGGPLVLVPIAAIPFIVIPGIVAQIPLAKLSREGLEEGAIRNAILMEAIYRAEDIKTLQAESRFRSVWERVNRTASEIGLRQRKLSASLVHFSQEIQQLAYVGVVVVGVYGILEGTMSYGSVLACSILTSRTIAPLGQIPAILGRLQNVRASKKGLNDLLKLPIDHDPDKDAYHRANLAGRFQFENVAFAYDQESKPALTIPQLKINPGERIAILGRVGAGKSTFLRLVGGLATPSQGRILLDDTAMNLIDVSDVRRDVGFVLQESGLFYGTIRENLLIANPHATDEQILEAMRLACADRLLLNQPHGLDLKLRENGMGLSGGQKQSLLLARVFLRGPNILLLDEPTASLDDMTEGAIIENLRGWIGSRSLIVATHRYQVLNLVDRIILVDGGRVVQDGPKAEILAMLSGQNNAQKQAAAASGKLKN